MKWIINLSKIDNDGGANVSDILLREDMPPYSKVSDVLIEKYLINNDFVDVSDGDHNGDNDSVEIHAQRIASLIHLIKTGVVLDPVTVFCCYINDNHARVEGIEDGWHRMRAGCYLNKKIMFSLDFNE